MSNHPKTAGIDWVLDELIFDEEGPGIAIALFSRGSGGTGEVAMGYRWCTSKTYFGRDSEWILLPHEFSIDAASRLATKRAAGMKGIKARGFEKMMAWIIREEAVIPGIIY